MTGKPKICPLQSKMKNANYSEGWVISFELIPFGARLEFNFKKALEFLRY